MKRVGPIHLLIAFTLAGGGLGIAHAVWSIWPWWAYLLSYTVAGTLGLLLGGLVNAIFFSERISEAASLFSRDMEEKLAE